MTTRIDNAVRADHRLAMWIDSTEVLGEIRRIVDVPRGWRIRRLRVARVFPARPVGFGAQYDVELANGSETSRGSLYLTPIQKAPGRQSSLLSVCSDDPLSIRGLAVCVEEGRMLLHTPDNDPTLPKLRDAFALSRMARHLKIPGPRLCRVLSYRPGRRCTVAYEDSTNSGAYVVGKIYNNGLAARIPALQQSLRKTLIEGGSVLRLPRILRRVRSLGMVVSEGLPAAPATMGMDPLERAAAAGRVLATLHQATVLPDQVFTPRDELIALDRWLGLCRRLGQTCRIATELREWLDRSRRSISSGRRCFLHRDFYEAQMFKTESGWALVDFDTAAQGDPELDVANYLAHETWRGVRGGSRAAVLSREGRAFLSSYLLGIKRAKLSFARLRFYLVASLMRVAIIHSLRSGEEVAARRLFHVARRCASPRFAAFSPFLPGGK